MIHVAPNTRNFTITIHYHPSPHSYPTQSRLNFSSAVESTRSCDFIGWIKPTVEVHHHLTSCQPVVYMSKRLPWQSFGMSWHFRFLDSLDLHLASSYPWPFICECRATFRQSHGRRPEAKTAKFCKTIHLDSKHTNEIQWPENVPLCGPPSLQLTNLMAYNGFWPRHK